MNVCILLTSHMVIKMREANISRRIHFFAVVFVSTLKICFDCAMQCIFSEDIVSLIEL